MSVSSFNPEESKYRGEVHFQRAEWKTGFFFSMAISPWVHLLSTRGKIIYHRRDTKYNISTNNISAVTDTAADCLI